MLPIKPAFKEFPSDSVRDQFDKVFSSSNYVPTSPKIHELRTRHNGFNAKMDRHTEKHTDRG
jgi:hypothetical protein